MGTRTYSRRAADGSRKLTALGRARMNQSGSAGVPSTANVFVPVPQDVDTFVMDADKKGELYRKNVELIYQATPESVTNFLDTISNTGHDVFMNSIALTAIAMDGTPEQRMRAIQLLATWIPGSLEIETLRLGSMDYLYYKSGDDNFIEDFWTRWANYGRIATSRQGWAQLHSYMAEIGPNKGMPYPNDFYEPGRRPVQLNPKIVALLQKEYERVQQQLALDGYPENGKRLYRGTRQPEGLSMESFSASKRIATEFADMGGISLRSWSDAGVVRTERVPRKYIMGSYMVIKEWPEYAVRGKKEYMVLGTAFYADKGVNRTNPANSQSNYITMESV